MARRRRAWRELGPAERATIAFGAVVQLVLQAAALRDLPRRSEVVTGPVAASRSGA